MQIEGTIEHITYRNDDNHYTVARFLAVSHRHPVTVVGYFASINTGSHYKLEGDWKLHPQYGHQFGVENYEEIIPTTAEGLNRYLGSGIIKGIGPSTAEKLVKKFGENILEIIENDPEKLAEISGISVKKALLINEHYLQQKQIKDLFNQFSAFDISPALSAKIYKTFGNESRKILTENPYRLADEIFGIGFKTADKIAQSIGIKKDAPERVCSGIIYTLKYSSEQGHLYLPLKELQKNASEILGIAAELITENLNRLVLENKIIIEEDSVFFTPFYLVEKRVAKRIQQFNMLKFNAHLGDSYFEKFFNSLTINLAPLQKEAVRQSVKSGILIITGGPGTGKTTAIKSILELAGSLKLRTALAAPTGRAAKRMNEATGHTAKTIHRLLEYSPATHTFNRDENNPVKADIFIIDEASMIDIFLFNSLIKAIPYSARLVLVGDADQLPPVGPGNVLKDLIFSQKVAAIHLREIFRQHHESLIITNSHLINNGKMPVTDPDSEDFFIIEEEDQEKISKTIIDMVTNKIPERFNLTPDDIQILSPMYKGLMGISYLNDTLQNMLNPAAQEKGEIKTHLGAFRLNDKVMQIKNNYDKGVFNGDIGKITDVDAEDQNLRVDFAGIDSPVRYEFNELQELVLAYACSVHKSQGSEYPCVILPLTTSHYIMLQRNLLYTALTRAKKLAIIIGSKKALGIAVANDKIEKRYTKLAQRLFEAQNQMGMMGM